MDSSSFIWIVSFYGSQSAFGTQQSYATTSNYAFFDCGTSGMQSIVDTVFLPTRTHFGFVSASLVREIATLKGDVTSFVAPVVHARLMDKLPT